MINKKKLKNKKVLLLIVLAIIIIIVNLCLILRNDKSESDTIDALEEEENQKVISKLENMNERNRMEYYLAIFINYLEDEDYESAYGLLYDEFKENYFPTLSEFEEYAKKTFPKMMNVEHDNIERNGDVYVLWIYISDLLNGSPEGKKEMNVVIKENDFNDFVMSFSVI